MRNLFLWFLLIASTGVYAVDINVGWTPPSDPRVNGYEVGWGTKSSNYSTLQKVIGPGTSQARVTIDKSGPLYFAVRSTGVEGGVPAVSKWSNEVVWSEIKPSPQTGLFVKINLSQ